MVRLTSANDCARISSVTFFHSKWQGLHCAPKCRASLYQCVTYPGGWFLFSSFETHTRNQRFFLNAVELKLYVESSIALRTPPRDALAVDYLSKQSNDNKIDPTIDTWADGQKDAQEPGCEGRDRKAQSRGVRNSWRDSCCPEVRGLISSTNSKAYGHSCPRDR